MNNTQGALHFGASIETTQWKRDIESMRRDILGLNNTVKNETRQIDSSFKNLSIGIAGYFSVNALKGFAMELINIRGEFQKTEIAFSTMLGDGVKAKELMGQMVTLAAKTPFSLQDVSAGAKQLLAFQVPANEVVDTLTRMGNIAAGLSVPLSRINLVYGQVKAKGKLMGDDLRQFTEAGIPMVAELAKKFGKTTGEIQAMVSAGKIGFKDVKDVLFSMTNEGGMFFNLMEKQSKSLSGQIANLGDSWDQMLNKIGEANEDILSSGIEGLSYLIEHYEDVIQVIGTLVSVYGTYRTALIATNALQKAAIWTEGTLAAIRFAQGISGMTKAQLIFNAAANANPYVLIASGIAAVVGAIVYLRTGNKEAKDTTEELTTAMEYQKAVSDSVGKAYESNGQKIVSSIDKEIAILKSSYSNIDMRKKAYQNLININKSFIGSVDNEFRATKQLSDAYTTLVSRLKELSIAKGKASLLEELSKKKASADLDLILKQDAYEKQRIENARKRASNAKKNNLGAGLYRETMLNDGVDYSTYNPVKKAKKQREEITKQFNLAANEVAKGARDAASKNDKELANAWGNIGETIVESSNKGTQGWYEDEIKRMEEENTGLLLNSKKRLENLAKIKEYRKLLNDKDPQQKQLAEILPLGSIAELERRAQLINDAFRLAVDGQVKLRKLDKYGNDKDKNGNPFLTGEIISTEEAGKRIEAINNRIKELQRKSFDEQLAELQRKIKVRDSLLENGYKKEITDGMFPELSGKNYLQSLQKIQADLNNINLSGKGSKETAENYIAITNVIDKLIGKQTEIENFTKSLDEMKSKMSSFDYLEELQKMYDGMPIGSEIDSEKRNEVKNRIEEELNIRRDFYKNFLKEKESFEQQKKNIDDKYNSIDNQILSSDKSEAEKTQLLKESAKARGKEYTTAFLNGLKDSNMWQMAFGDIAQMTNREIRKNIESLKTQLESAKINGATAEEIKIISDRIKELKGVLNTNPFQKVADSFKDIFKEGATVEEKLTAAQNAFQGMGETVNFIADSFGGMDEASKDAVEDIMAIGNAAFDLGKSIASGDVSGMIKAGIQLIGSIAKALNGDKKKERNIKRQAQALKELERAYNDLAYAAEKAFGAQKYSAQTDVIKNLEQQRIKLQQMISEESSKKKSDQGKIDEWKSQIQSINQSIDQIKVKIVEDVLQTSLTDAAAKIGDALVDAFGRGEDAVKSLETAANDMIKNLLKNQLNLVLQKKLEPILKQLFAATGIKEDGSGSFTGLTAQQIADFKAQVLAAGADMQQFLNAYSDIFSGLSGNASSLEGAIKGITSEEAGIIAGQMNAIRIMQAEALQTQKDSQLVLRNQLLQLTQIEINTRTLHSINKNIEELNRKTKDGGLRGSGII